MKKVIRIIAAPIIGFFLLTTLSCADSAPGPNQGEIPVDLNLVKTHQVKLQEIASQNGNNRAAGTAGYDQSVQYVAAQLTAAGYSPVLQEFTITRFKETSDPVLEQVTPNSVVYPRNVPEGFITLSYSGSGNVTALVQPVDLMIPMDPNNPPSTSTSGCEPEDYAGFVPGNIALLQRGSCTFEVKVANAQTAGAAGVIIMNEGQPDRTEAFAGTLGHPDFLIPAVFANYSIGVELSDLIQGGFPVRAHLKVDALLESRITCNIIADTPGGDATRTVVVGAHLDSVSAGPGINDNASGSAAILEVAYKMGLLRIEPKHKIRFAFWSAEEEGLLGSEYYVAHLAPEERAKISLYLNVDMIASPNYVRFVYDGDGSDSPNAGPPGSEQIEKLFTDYFAGTGLPTDPTAIDGSSDHGSFAARNIPVGGIYAGSSEIKTEEMAKKYGGTAGAPCDPNYHTPDDTVANLNYTIEEQMLKAIAYAVLTYGNTLLNPPPRAGLAGKRMQTYQPTYKGPRAIR